MVKNSPANAGDIRDMGLIPGSGKSPGGKYGIPLQYSCLENPMERGAWQAMVHGVTKSQTWLKQLSLHAHEKYLAEYPYKDTKKKREDNISKFKNRIRALELDSLFLSFMVFQNMESNAKWAKKESTSSFTIWLLIIIVTFSFTVYAISA